MIALVVSLDVVPGRLEEFTAAIASNAERSFADEPGCLYFDVAQSLADDQSLVGADLHRWPDLCAVDHQSTPLRLDRGSLARYQS